MIIYANANDFRLVSDPKENQVIGARLSGDAVNSKFSPLRASVGFIPVVEDRQKTCFILMWRFDKILAPYDILTLWQMNIRGPNTHPQTIMSRPIINRPFSPTANEYGKMAKGGRRTEDCQTESGTSSFLDETWTINVPVPLDDSD